MFHRPRNVQPVPKKEFSTGHQVMKIISGEHNSFTFSDRCVTLIHGLVGTVVHVHGIFYHIYYPKSKKLFCTPYRKVALRAKDRFIEDELTLVQL